MKVAGRNVAIRWTVGNVSRRGFEALRLSIWGAWNIFGPEAAYVVCVNTITAEHAKHDTGDVPDAVEWLDTTGDLPSFLRRHLDPDMAEGVAWKFAPLRLYPDRFELSLDNDCILWRLPHAIRAWLEDGEEGRCLIAEDVRPCFGKFARYCGTQPRNGGIRGFPPGFDLERALRALLRQNPCMLTSELDEQGLNVAALSRVCDPIVVRVREVTICSPFPPHMLSLGSCGAHFVGLNARHLPWSLNGKPAVDYIREHWLRHREALYDRVRINKPC